MELVAWELMSYSIFYQYRNMDVKIQGIPRLWWFPGFFILSYIFRGCKFPQLPISFKERDWKFFSGIIFFESNHLRFNSTEYMSQTTILSREYWFLKNWSSIPLYINKKWNSLMLFEHSQVYLPSISKATWEKVCSYFWKASVPTWSIQNFKEH